MTVELDHNVDMIMQILDFLSSPDLLRLRLVNHELQGVVDMAGIFLFAWFSLQQRFASI